MKLSEDALMMLGLAAAVVAAAYYLKKKVAGVGGLGNAAAAVVSGAVDAGVSGVAYGLGDAFGLPRTDQTACQAALRAGDMWTASYKCPAGTFLGGLWDEAKAAPAAIANKATDMAGKATSGTTFDAAANDPWSQAILFGGLGA